MALILLILLGVVFQGVAMFRSGVLYDYGIGYFGPLARDGIWHEALIAQLSKGLPIENPGFAGELLRNYHYYYDFLVALITKVGISPSLLVYRFFPILFSVLLGIGTYKLSNILFKDKKTSLLSVFFAYFASSFGWIVSLIKGEPLGGESAFWANQPVSMNLNPPYAISIVIILFTLILTNSFIRRPKLLKGAAIILLAGTLIGFKVYAGVLLLGALFVLGVKRLIFDKDYRLIGISLFSIIISYSILGKDSSRLIEFKPFWLIDTMIDAGDRVGITNFTARRFAYLAEGKWFGLAVIEIISLTIFFVGNLGTRIIGIFGISKKQIKSDLFILIFSIMVGSLIPPLLFIQKGNPWNIVQFFYYFLFFAGFLAANGLKKFPPLVLILIILISPISSVTTFRSWLYPRPPAYLGQQELEALLYLKTQGDGVVLKHPFSKNLRSQFKDPFPLAVYADNAYVSAYSGKSVFIEDVEQQIILNTDYRRRLVETERFFIEKDLLWSNKFLKDNNISYLYLPKIYQLPMAEEEYAIDKIFENDGANIYKVK